MLSSITVVAAVAFCLAPGKFYRFFAVGMSFAVVIVVVRDAAVVVGLSVNQVFLVAQNGGGAAVSANCYREAIALELNVVLSQSIRQVIYSVFFRA